MARKNPIDDDEGKELLIELRTILIGKEGTSEEGMSGSMNKMEKHLAKINGTNADQEVRIEKNRDRISTHWKIGGGFLSLFGLALIAVLCKVLDMF